MWRSLLALSFIAVLWTQPPTVPVTFAWDLDPTHADATWEVEANGTIYPCLSVTVTPQDRRCTATLPRTTTTFRVRGTNATGIGAWSALITDVWTGPGPFVVRAHFEGSSSVAYTFLDSIGKQSTDGANVTTASADTTGANLIVVGVCSHQPSTAPTLSDSKSNNWNGLTVQNISPTRVRLFYAAGPSIVVGSGHTFTVAGASSFPAVAAIWFSGGNASPADQENGNTVSGVTSGQPGSITPTEDNEVIVAGMCCNGGGTYSIDSPFAAEENFTIVPGVAYGILLAYSIQTTATARNPTFTFGSGAAGMRQASFKVGPPSTRGIIRNSVRIRPAAFAPGRAR